MKSIMNVLRLCSVVFLASASLGLANSDLKEQAETIQNVLGGTQELAQPQEAKPLTPEQRMGIVDRLAAWTGLDKYRVLNAMTEAELEQKEVELMQQGAQLDNEFAHLGSNAQEALKVYEQEWQVAWNDCGMDANCRDGVLATMVAILEVATSNKDLKEKELKAALSDVQAGLKKIADIRTMRQEQAEREKRKKEEQAAQEALKQQEAQEATPAN